MNAGTLEMIDLEQMFEASLTCSARRDLDCPNEPAWRTVCPGCSVQFLWCEPCRQLWLKHWRTVRMMDPKARASCPKCPHRYANAPVFLPL